MRKSGLVLPFCVTSEIHKDTTYHTIHSTNKFKVTLYILDNVSLKTNQILIFFSKYAGLAGNHTELRSKNLSNKRNFNPAFPQLTIMDCEFQ